MRFPPSLQIKRQLLRCIMQGQFEIDKTLPTIQTLADTFGVSTVTVQKAIHMLSAEGILEAKPKVGCMVKSAGPRRNRCKTIGLVAPHDMGYLTSGGGARLVIEAARKELANGGYTLELIPLSDINTYNLIYELEQHTLGGILLFELDLDFLILDIAELRLHTVSMDYDATRLGIPSVTYDNAFGTFLSTRHLIELGHRRIAFMRPLLTSLIKNVVDAPEEARMLGYRMAMQQSGLPIRVEERRERDALRAHVEKVLSGPDRPTALVTSADWYAGAIRSHAENMGIQVPADISITGFGEHPLGRKTAKQFTSIRVVPSDMGRSAARLLLERFSGKRTPREHIVLPVELVDRGTTGPPTDGREE